MIFRTFQENAATLFLMLHQFLAMWIRSELYLIYFATEQSPIVKYVCATAIQSWSNLRNEWLHSKNWDQKVWASEFRECARMHANGTRMPLNGVQMHQKVSRRFQKFPEVSECIRITVVSAPNWPKIGRSVRSTSVLVIGRLVRSTSTASVLIIPAATTTPTPIIPNRWKIEITKPRQVIRRPALFHVVLVKE